MDLNEEYNKNKIKFEVKVRGWRQAQSVVFLYRSGSGGEMNLLQLQVSAANLKIKYYKFLINIIIYLWRNRYITYI